MKPNRGIARLVAVIHWIKDFLRPDYDVGHGKGCPCNHCVYVRWTGSFW